MNGKAYVSKQLNAKHLKILEGLLKRPENRDCADCKSKGPRWASVNLGIFVCLQCSGIHRSLGVHISKVRSATLDTWLPDQIAFIESMGNEKSNSYWEAELPPQYNRVGMENFVRAKYVEKKWIRRDVKVISPPPVKEKLVTEIRPVSETRNAGSNNVVPKLPKPVYVTNLQKGVSAIKSQEVHQQPELKKEKPLVKASPTDSAPELHHATDLFDKRPMELTKQNGTKVVSSTEKQSPERIRPDQEAVETRQIVEYKVPSSVAPNEKKFDSGIEELLRDFQWNTSAAVAKPAEDVKSDILNLHDKASVAVPSFTQPSPQKRTSTNINQNHGRMIQQTGNAQPLNTPATSARLSTRVAMAPIGGKSAAMARPTFNKPSVVPTPSGQDYDFSFLLHGMYTKR